MKPFATDSGVAPASRSRPIYFAHIPKTGGSSVRAWLNSHFGVDTCPAMVADQLVAMPLDEVANSKAFAGHFHSYLADYLGRDLLTVTVLREPTARTRSHWHQVRRHPGHPHHARVVRQSFEEFVLDDRNRVMIEDYQARYLAKGTAGLQKMAKRRLNPDHGPFALAEALEEASLATAKPALQDAARQALADMAVVGVTDRLHEFLQHLAEVTGLPPPDEQAVPRENVTEEETEAGLGAHARDRLLELTRIDGELYRQACG